MYGISSRKCNTFAGHLTQIGYLIQVLTFTCLVALCENSNYHFKNKAGNMIWWLLREQMLIYGNLILRKSGNFKTKTYKFGKSAKTITKFRTRFRSQVNTYTKEYLKTKLSLLKTHLKDFVGNKKI